MHKTKRSADQKKSRANDKKKNNNVKTIRQRLENRREKKKYLNEKDGKNVKNVGSDQVKGKRKIVTRKQISIDINNSF